MAHDVVIRNGRVDTAIDRAISIASDESTTDPLPRLRAFELILLVHLFATVASGAFPRTHVEQGMQMFFAAAIGGCLALWFMPRMSRLAIAGAFCTMFGLQYLVFPQTGNHSFLELWLLLLLVLIGRSTRDEGVVLLAALRGIVAVMLFYTGLQKVLYGTYIDGQFLAAQIMIKAQFADIFGWIVPADEISRLQTLQWDRVGAGPVRSDAPLLILASNAVYLFEIAIPLLLLWRPTRRAAVIALLLFTIAIQSGAREMFFGGLRVNITLLFWPRDLHSRALWLFLVYYAGLATLRFAFGDMVLQ